MHCADRLAVQESSDRILNSGEERQDQRILNGTYWRPILQDGDCKPKEECIQQLHELYNDRYEEVARDCGYADLHHMRSMCPHDIIVIFQADQGIVTVKRCVVVDAKEIKCTALNVQTSSDRILKSGEKQDERIPDGEYLGAILLEGDCKPKEKCIRRIHELYTDRYEELAHDCGYDDLRQMRCKCRYDIIVTFLADKGIVTVQECTVVYAKYLNGSHSDDSDGE